MKRGSSMRALLSVILAVILTCPVWGEPKGVRLGKAQPQLRDAAQSVTFSPDGKSIAWVSTTSGADENTVTVHVWDIAGRKEACRCTFTEDTAKATTPVVFTPDGKGILVGTYHEGGGPDKSSRGSDSRVRLWDARTGKELLRFTGQGGGD